MVLRGQIPPTRGAVAPARTASRAPTGRNGPDRDESEGTNVRVVVRCRGRNDREIKAKSSVVVDTTLSRSDIAIKAHGESKTYSVDRVFGPEADQSLIFDEIVAPIVDDMLYGINCTVFAYGQTGTGKT